MVQKQLLLETQYKSLYLSLINKNKNDQVEGAKISKILSTLKEFQRAENQKTTSEKIKELEDQIQKLE